MHALAPGERIAGDDVSSDALLDLPLVERAHRLIIDSKKKALYVLGVGPLSRLLLALILDTGI